MMLADIFTYNKNKYFILIAIFIVMNAFLHPLTAGYIPTKADGTLDYASAFTTNLVTFGISFNILGLIIGGGVAAFKRRNKEPLQIRTAKSVISTIFYMQLIFATLHMMFFIREVIVVVLDRI